LTILSNETQSPTRIGEGRRRKPLNGNVVVGLEKLSDKIISPSTALTPDIEPRQSKLFLSVPSATSTESGKICLIHSEKNHSREGEEFNPPTDIARCRNNGFNNR
jgi:hypothetical protein